MEDKKIIRNSAQCLLCGEDIFSIHRHDFKLCRCENLSVDGGQAYLKRSVREGWDTVKETSIFEESGDE